MEKSSNSSELLSRRNFLRMFFGLSLSLLFSKKTNAGIRPEEKGQIEREKGVRVFISKILYETNQKSLLTQLFPNNQMFLNLNNFQSQLGLPLVVENLATWGWFEDHALEMEDEKGRYLLVFDAGDDNSIYNWNLHNSRNIAIEKIAEENGIRTEKFPLKGVQIDGGSEVMLTNPNGQKYWFVGGNQFERSMDAIMANYPGKTREDAKQMLLEALSKVGDVDINNIIPLKGIWHVDMIISQGFNGKLVVKYDPDQELTGYEKNYSDAMKSIRNCGFHLIYAGDGFRQEPRPSDLLGKIINDDPYFSFGVNIFNVEWIKDKLIVSADLGSLKKPSIVIPIQSPNQKGIVLNDYDLEGLGKIKNFQTEKGENFLLVNKDDVLNNKSLQFAILEVYNIIAKEIAVLYSIPQEKVLFLPFQGSEKNKYGTDCALLIV